MMEGRDDERQGTGQKRRALSALDEGIALAREGDRQAARQIFRRIIQSTPGDEQAWLWLAWVADTPERSLRTLHEAQAFLPDSERLEQAVEWAQRERESQQAAASDDGAPEERELAVRRWVGTAQAVVSRAGGIGASVGRGWQRVLDGFRLAFGRLGLPHVALPTFPSVGRMRGLVGPLLSALAIIALFMFAVLGIVNARRQPTALAEIVLPTRLPDLTATPTVKQRTEPLWIQTNVAFTREDSEAAIAALNEIRQIDPDDKEARAQLAKACYQRALGLIEANKLETARQELDRAIRLHAANNDLQDLRQELKLYMAGVEAYWAHDWQRATEQLKLVYDLDPDFRDTRDMLGQAYYRLGVWYQEEERWDEAANAFKEALRLAPGIEDAKVRLAQVMDILIPPKRIELDLSDHKVTVYENHRPVWRFTVCVGRPSAPTVPGRYQILDKMPMAYASKWSLKMPWWLGIYWAGGSENGFHALPILSNGHILWRGALGTGCSFGCIVLDTDDAIRLYNWAEIGTVVLVKR